MFKLFIASLIMVFTSSAFADQCQYVSKSEAEAAFEILEKAAFVQSLCEPCGEVYPAAVNFTSLAIKEVGFMGYWGIFLDNKNIDLAYAYADGKNLAMLVGCEATGVSESLK